MCLKCVHILFLYSFKQLLIQTDLRIKHESNQYLNFRWHVQLHFRVWTDVYHFMLLLIIKFIIYTLFILSVLNKSQTTQLQYCLSSLTQQTIKQHVVIEQSFDVVIQSLCKWSQWLLGTPSKENDMNPSSDRDCKVSSSWKSVILSVSV